MMLAELILICIMGACVFLAAYYTTIWFHNSVEDWVEGIEPIQNLGDFGYGLLTWGLAVLLTAALFLGIVGLAAFLNWANYVRVW